MMDRSLPPAAVIAAAILLGVGIASAGYFVGKGVLDSRVAAARAVTVKGLAEQDVRADLALWPIQFTAAGNTLAEVQSRVDSDATRISEFLKTYGLDGEEVEIRRPTVTDLQAQAYGPDAQGRQRFIVNQTVSVRTNDVDAMLKASSASGELVKAGIVLTEGGQPSFLFTKLNDVKPELIAAATKNARESASQFARDSGSAVGPIRSASQGVVQILPRDGQDQYLERQEINKTVRVVVTVDYALVD